MCRIFGNEGELWKNTWLGELMASGNSKDFYRKFKNQKWTRIENLNDANGGPCD